MRSEPGALVALFLQFAVLSFFALGGASTVVPELQRQMVEMRGWLDDRQFSELYAIAQAAPGPNVMFVALLGHFIAGVPGAVVTTAPRRHRGDLRGRHLDPDPAADRAHRRRSARSCRRRPLKNRNFGARVPAPAFVIALPCVRDDRRA
jgi:Chromate transporter